MPVDPQRFRDLFGTVPSFVSVVTTLDSQDRPVGFTCSALSAVSVDPALLLVCVDRRSVTLPAILERGAYVVNILAEGGRDLSETFAGKSYDKFADLEWTPSRVAGGLPVLHHLALAYAECLVVQQIEAGDHWIVVGQVEETAVFDRRPLLYYRRDYLTWDHDGEKHRAALTDVPG